MKKKLKVLASMLLVGSILLAGCGTKEEDVTIDQAKVKLGEYKGLRVELEETYVTDETVENYAESLLNYHNSEAASERTVVEDGDAVYVSAVVHDTEGNLIEDGGDYEGFVFVGSGTTYEELEQGLIGVETGTTVDIPMTFPDPYEYNEELSGTEAVITADVQYIRDENPLLLDTLTDEDADMILAENYIEGYSGKDGFLAAIKDTLTAQEQADMRTLAYEAICAQLLETCEVKPFPGAELEARTDDYIANIERMCTNYYDMSFEEYCNSIGHTVEDYRADAKETLRETLTLELIFTAIADKEDIQYDEADFQAYIDGVIETYSYSSEQEIFDEHGEDYVKRAFRIEYVIDWLIQNADIVYVPAESDVTE